jgi:hypothetical protein
MDPTGKPVLPDRAPRGLAALAHALRARLTPRTCRLLLGLCLVAVLFLALLPADPLPNTGWDKGDHVLAFAWLTWLGRGAFPGRLRWLVAGLFAYGVLIELLQSLTPYRYADALDLVGDAIGIAVGLAVGAAAAAWARGRATDEIA